jgi:hypothetical protein
MMRYKETLYLLNLFNPISVFSITLWEMAQESGEFLAVEWAH